MVIGGGATLGGVTEVDIVSTCKDKLTYFRIKELKDVLGQLGLPKQGKKQDLIDRIFSLLSDDQVPRSHGWAKRSCIGKDAVAKIIDDTYRKMHSPGATELASKSQSGSDVNVVKPKVELGDSYRLDMKVRCPCGSSMLTESMIKCEDSLCQVWQHINCVIIPEKVVDGIQPEMPTSFYCEICRINRADPFWVTVKHPLLPSKIHSSGLVADGSTTAVHSVDRTFQLSRPERESLQRTDYDLQVWCILLNDKVPFRMQWPQFAELQVNGISLRTSARPGAQLLGINGRDDGPLITTCSREGVNKICLSRSDNRIFCIGIRIMKRRTVQQVLSLVPKEGDGESFEDAVARVRRCIGGGTTIENAGSDSDLEVVAGSDTVNLRCPMTASRIKIAGRFKPCIHMGCFDLESFVELNQRSRKWQCPICLKNYSLESIIIDPYFNRITTLLQKCGEDVNEIDVKPDGSWRANNECEHKELARWHFADSSLCPVADEDVKPDIDVLKQIKQEVSSEGHRGLKIGIKRNRDGLWEVSRQDELKLSSENNMLETFANRRRVIPMSSSATGSYNGEDSVNQEGGGHFDLMNNGHEFESFNSLLNTNRRIRLESSKDPVIVLSDSEEENINNSDSHQANGIGNLITTNLPGVPATYTDNPCLGENETACLGLFSNEADEFGIPLWPGSQNGTRFQLFGTDAEVQDTLGVQHDPLGLSAINSLDLTADRALIQNPLVEDLPCHPNIEMNKSIVDNTLVFGNDDPSLQIFLPSRPNEASMQAESSYRGEMINNIRTDDWISLRLGGGGVHGNSSSANGIVSQQVANQDTGMDTLANAASLVRRKNDENVNKRTSDSQRPDSHFNHPRQPRSNRQSLYMSIDSDTD